MNHVAKYFRSLWPKRLAGDFTNGPTHSFDPNHAGNAMNSTAGIGLDQAHRVRAQDDDATTVALHAAENEGWKLQSEPATQHYQWSLPPHQASVRHFLKPL
jgi:hypothetical protein